MKQLLKAYTSFTRTERMGIVVLLSIIMILLVVKASMYLWVHSEYDKAKEAQLVKSWEAYKATASTTKPNSDVRYKAAYKHEEHSPTDTGSHRASKPRKLEEEKTVKAHLFNFDPNMVDSPTLRKLGLREKTTSIFLHWRAKGKKFYRKEEFKKVYTLTPEEYERLAPYIVIDRERLK